MNYLMQYKYFFLQTYAGTLLHYLNMGFSGDTK